MRAAHYSESVSIRYWCVPALHLAFFHGVSPVNGSVLSGLLILIAPSEVAVAFPVNQGIISF